MLVARRFMARTLSLLERLLSAGISDLGCVNTTTVVEKRGEGEMSMYCSGKLWIVLLRKDPKLAFQLIYRVVNECRCKSHTKRCKRQPASIAYACIHGPCICPQGACSACSSTIAPYNGMCTGPKSGWRVSHSDMSILFSSLRSSRRATSRSSAFCRGMSSPIFWVAGSSRLRMLTVRVSCSLAPTTTTRRIQH